MHYAPFLKYFISLITDPYLRMANILFLGVLILSYFLYKFLRRFFIAEYHQTYDDAFRSNLSPAIVTTAGPGGLCENQLIYNRHNRVLKSSTPCKKFLVKNHKNTGIREKNSKLKPNSLINQSQFKSSNPENYVEEERDLKKKDDLYLAALNRGRPSGYPKISKLPNVGYLPTIFEKLPYPVLTEDLRSLIEAEAMLETENEFEERQNFIQLESNVEEEIHTTKNIAEEETSNMQLMASVAEKEPACMQLEVNSAETKSVNIQLGENIAEEDSTIVTSEIPKKKKKKFRKVRKFFSRFSCIPRVKK